MARLLALAATLAILVGCSPRYDCAEVRLFEHTFGEQCGPAGSQGNLYFEDEMVRLIIGADFEDFLTEESSIIYDYIPTFNIGFRSVHLAEGVSLTEDQVVVRCSRSMGLGTGYYTWYGQGTVDVLGPSNRTQVGGQSWRFAWDITCDPEADMEAHGEDVIELFVDEFGWETDLWGLPADWPY
ncbi:MAG: hypothetical protein EP330_12680 [Deltaproteobacteria bacterium]|nr:MAG: hypothetical protein EP330_12680 [Deltaproteobacteria bacterium]